MNRDLTEGIIHDTIEMSFRAQAQAATEQRLVLSVPGFAESFQHVAINLPRQTGKTTAIRHLFRPGIDSLVTVTHEMKRRFIQNLLEERARQLDEIIRRFGTHDPYFKENILREVNQQLEKSTFTIGQFANPRLTVGRNPFVQDYSGDTEAYEEGDEFTGPVVYFDEVTGGEDVKSALLNFHRTMWEDYGRDSVSAAIGTARIYP